MKYTGYTCAAALLLLSTACSSDDPAVVAPAENPGEEVNFTAAPIVEGSRTIYGDENADGIKINWLQGDIVAIASPQAESGFQQSLYTVNIDPANASQNYASSLEHAGETGVRWGEQAANFYSVYPGKEGAMTVSGSTVTAHATIPVQQDNYLPNGFQPATQGVTFPLNPDKGTMEAQVMWAQTANQNTNPVKLQYNPCSTTLYMTFDGYTKGAHTGTDTGNSLMIESITLTAPEGTNIAGDFDINFNADATTAPTFTATTNSSNMVTVSTFYQTSDGQEGRRLTIEPNQSFSIKMILNPSTTNNVQITKDWTITINTRGAGSYSSPLNIAAGTNTTLKAGMIHKMHFGTFTLDGDAIWQWTPDSWMSQIPRNVYLSEISMAGAWYAYDGQKSTPEGYQSSTIAQLFSAGIRAFQVETRVGTTGSDADEVPENCTIVISGTGDNGSALSGPHTTYRNATPLTTLLDLLKTQLSSHPTEFAVLAINYSDGGSTSVDDDFKAYWIRKLQTALAGYSDIIYSTASSDGVTVNGISPSTTVGDVLGKLIVIINVDNENENAGVTTWPNSLFAYTDMSWEQNNLHTSLISPMTWASWPGIPAQNVGIAETSLEANQGKMYLNYTLANRTFVYSTSTNTGSFLNPRYDVTLHFDPTTGTDANTNNSGKLATLQDRKDAINTIISNSDQVWAGKKHNVWYFIGAGGTLSPLKDGASQSNGTLVIAGGEKANGTTYGTGNRSTLVGLDGVVGLNTYLLKAIQDKIAGNKPSPVGLVFFNQCTNATYDGPALIQEIFQMNNQFELLCDEKKDPWPNGTPTTGRASFSSTVDFVTEPAIR